MEVISSCRLHLLQHLFWDDRRAGLVVAASCCVALTTVLVGLVTTSGTLLLILPVMSSTLPGRNHVVPVALGGPVVMVLVGAILIIRPVLPQSLKPAVLGVDAIDAVVKRAPPTQRAPHSASVHVDTLPPRLQQPSAGCSLLRDSSDP